MALDINSIIAAVAMVADGVGEALVALSVGFAAKPTAIGLALAAVLMFFFGAVTPVGFQVESLIVAARKVKQRIHLLHVVILAGIVGAILGAFGLFQVLSDFIGNVVLSGMLAGVGILLVLAAADMAKRQKTVGLTSIVIAVVVYLLTKDLVYSLVASVVAAAIVSRFVKTESISVSMKNEKIELISSFKQGTFFKTLFSKPVIAGALALLALRIGTSLAFSNIDADLAGGVDPKTDAVNVIAGLGGVASALFGGAPTEPLISATAATSSPVLSGVVFLAIMAVVCFFLLIPKLAKILPEQVIAGFLFVLGGLIAFPENIAAAVQANAVVGGITALVTAVSDPFTGMVVGVVFNYLTVSLGQATAVGMFALAGSAYFLNKPKGRELLQKISELRIRR